MIEYSSLVKISRRAHSLVFILMCSMLYEWADEVLDLESFDFPYVGSSSKKATGLNRAPGEPIEVPGGPIEVPGFRSGS